eukprot:190451-Chlamydomonas_euryale.AAC.2
MARFEGVRNQHQKRHDMVVVVVVAAVPLGTEDGGGVWVIKMHAKTACSLDILLDAKPLVLMPHCFV